MTRQQAIDEAVSRVEPWHKEMLLNIARFMPKNNFIKENELAEYPQKALKAVRAEFNQIMASAEKERAA